MLLSSNNICAVIPFYNERSTIAEVLLKALQYCNYVIAVNDGSTDGSETCLPDSRNIILLNIANNKGKGNALRLGFLKSIELRTKLTFTIDADLQHPIELIPLFIEKSKTNDIVIGNRMKDKKYMPIQRILSNTITSKILTLKTGINIFDSQCGFRAYKTSVLPLLCTTFHGYEAESEILVLAAKQRLKVGFVDIPAIYGNEKSKMKAFQAISGFMKVIFS